MYLSRIKINRQVRSSIKLLGSLQVMHAAVEGCFHQEDSTRKLWRLDYFYNQPYILILSQQKPDFTHFVEQFGYKGDAGEMRDCQKILDGLENGQRYRFRFCGNPVHSIKEKGNTGRGRVVPHMTAAQQEEWFDKKSKAAGFSTEQCSIVQRDVRKFSRKGKIVTLHTAVYEGVLKIHDVETFKTAIVSGVGRAKSYGCGLLTLARV